MKAQIYALLIMSMFAISCAKSSGGSGGDGAQAVPPGTDVYIPPTTGIGQNPGWDWAFGGTSQFVFDSADVFRQYTGRYINNLSQINNVRVNLNLDKYGSSYGGTVTIRYNSGINGQIYEGFFTSGHDAASTQYNIWFTQNGNKVWHGFFEDYRGAVVVVIDNVVETVSSGTTTSRLGSGSVWFKNFDVQGYAVHPPHYCWFQVGGVFDCRAWKTASGVNTTAGLYPDSGYVRLGTFQNVDLKKAFNDLVW